jgi:flavin-binding protein dodecin
MPSVEKIEKVERIKGTDLADLHSPKPKVSGDSYQRRSKPAETGDQMSDSRRSSKVARPISNVREVELEGVSSHSWEDAVRHALEVAATHFSAVFELEVTRQTAVVEAGKIQAYHTVVRIRYHDEHWGLAEVSPDKPHVEQTRGSKAPETQRHKIPIFGFEPHHEVVKHYQEIQHPGDGEQPQRKPKAPKDTEAER